ncbi:TPA: hypothetical protein DDW69_02675, partial [candidate division CPR2 bacterium]|nr:hypothetical protein [candidate division CPR2 bacterium]
GLNDRTAMAYSLKDNAIYLYGSYGVSRLGGIKKYDPVANTWSSTIFAPAAFNENVIYPSMTYNPKDNNLYLYHQYVEGGVYKLALKKYDTVANTWSAAILVPEISSGLNDRTAMQ